MIRFVKCNRLPKKGSPHAFQTLAFSLRSSHHHYGDGSFFFSNRATRTTQSTGSFGHSRAVAGETSMLSLLPRHPAAVIAAINALLLDDGEEPTLVLLYINGDNDLFEPIPWC